MSQPWHTDYNSCATHQPDPIPNGNNTLYWSWPGQRPVQVYPKNKCIYNEANNTWNLGGQVFSIRGPGTKTDYAQNLGRFQSYCDYVQNWEKTGFIIQASKVESDNGEKFEENIFIEVASQYSNKDSNEITDSVLPAKTVGAPMPEAEGCPCTSRTSTNKNTEVCS